MALSEAILVCLTERPMSGYDLAKNFDASIGFFWRASHQQIYRELGKLREKGYVKSEEIDQVGKPNRIVHTITKSGRQALLAWSTKPSKQPSIKDELLVKFYGMDGVNIPAFIEQLSLRLEQHQTKLSKYMRIKSRHYDNKELSLNQKGKLIALEIGIEQEKQNIENLSVAIGKVRAL
jgi:DNA-binding PadR family transcriptional regulator